MKRLLIPFLLLCSSILAIAENRKVIVLRIQFADTEFTSDDKRQREIADSASIYFSDQFSRETIFTFDTGPVVTLSRNLAWYGGNTPSRHDGKLHEAVIEACLAADSEIDFSLYEGIMILAAGRSEAEGAGDDHIWPQKASLSEWGASLMLDHTRIEDFAISTETSGTGTFCHEFGHLLGLSDLYDTDGEGSGGTSRCLWGSLSLMDKSGTPFMSLSNLSSPDMDRIGMGKCDTLKVGEYELRDLGESRRYLKALTDKDGEYFLLECRRISGWDDGIGCTGLIIYHIDRSDNDAGYSSYYKRNLGAGERWELNQVNCNPNHQCVDLVEAIQDATKISEVTFPQKGVNSFTSATSPAFKYYSGTLSNLALTDIRMTENGSVMFNVMEPVSFNETAVFQDAAIVSWNTMAGGACRCTLNWYSDGQLIGSVMTGSSCHTIEGLKPGKKYELKLEVETQSGAKFSASTYLTTGAYRPGSRPYINFEHAERNDDGSFKSGASIPLRVTNLPDKLRSEWRFNNKRINIGDDGYYHLSGSGTLKAVVEDSDGNTQVIIKEITVR